MGTRRIDQLPDAVAAVEHGTELLLEYKGAEPGAEFLQGVLEVLPDEEIGIRKPGAHDVLVALADQVESLVIAVADDDKVGEQFPIPPQGEVTLVLLHDRDEDITGKAEVIGVEAAQDGEGFLNQVGDLVQ